MTEGGSFLQILFKSSNEKEKIKIYSIRGSFENGGRSKKKQKTLQHFWFVYPALSACQSRKKRGWKARFREGTKSWLLVSKLSPPTRSTFLPFLHPFCIHARRRADKGWEEKKKEERRKDGKKQREIQEDATCVNTCTARFEAAWLYIYSQVLCRSGEGNARERKRNEFLSGSPSAQHKSRRLSFTRTFTLRALRC